WLAEPEKLWSPWRLEGEELLEAKRDALLLSLKEQEAAGIDIISDGEQTRQHFVTTFIEHLSGVDFEKRETVRIRDRYDASVPTVYDAVAPTLRPSKAAFSVAASALFSVTEKNQIEINAN